MEFTEALQEFLFHQGFQRIKYDSKILWGKDANGNKLWVHCASGTGVVLNSPDYVTQYRRRNDVDLEGDLVPAALDVEEAGTSG